jgi:hypothetical protein
MRKSFTNIFAAVLATVCLAVLPATAQNLGQIKQSARTAAAGISVSTAKGITTVTYKNKQVWSGKTTARVTGLSKVVNGTEYAAAFAGDKVIWESAPGAAKKVK